MSTSVVCGDPKAVHALSTMWRQQISRQKLDLNPVYLFVNTAQQWLITSQCIPAFGRRVLLYSPIWLKESEPAGMTRGLLESHDTVFLITFQKWKMEIHLNQSIKHLNLLEYNQHPAHPLSRPKARWEKKLLVFDIKLSDLMLVNWWKYQTQAQKKQWNKR